MGKAKAAKAKAAPPKVEATPEPATKALDVSAQAATTADDGASAAIAAGAAGVEDASADAAVAASPEAALVRAPSGSADWRFDEQAQLLETGLQALQRRLQDRRAAAQLEEERMGAQLAESQEQLTSALRQWQDCGQRMERLRGEARDLLEQVGDARSSLAGVREEAAKRREDAAEGAEAFAEAAEEAPRAEEGEEFEDAAEDDRGQDSAASTGGEVQKKGWLGWMRK